MLSGWHVNSFFVLFFFFLFQKISSCKLAADHRAELAAATNSVLIPGGMTFQKHTYPPGFPTLICCTPLTVTAADQRRQAAPLWAWIQRCYCRCSVEVADLLRGGSMVAVLHVLLRRAKPIVFSVCFCVLVLLMNSSAPTPGVASLCLPSHPSVPQVLSSSYPPPPLHLINHSSMFCLHTPLVGRTWL